MMSSLTCSCFYLWRSWLLPRQGTGLNFYGSAKHLGFTSKPLQQDQLHVTTEGGDPLHHLAAQRGLCPCPGCLHLRDVPITVRVDNAPTALLSCAVLFRMFPDVPCCSWIHHYGSRRRGERREEEIPGRRGPSRRWQGSATMDHSLRVCTPVLPSPSSPS